MGVLLLIGTRKGLFLIRGDDERRSFEVEGPLLPGWSINHAVLEAARHLPPILSVEAAALQ